MPSHSVLWGTLAWCSLLLSDQKPDFVTIYNYSEFPIEAYIAYTKNGKLIRKLDLATLETPNFVIIMPGASQRLSRPLRVSGLDRDAIVREINLRRTSDGAGNNTYNEFIRGNGALPKQGKFAARYNVASLISKVYVGRNDADLLDVFMSTLIGGLHKPLAISTALIVKEPLKQYVDGWSAVLKAQQPEQIDRLLKSPSLENMKAFWSQRNQDVADLIIEIEHLGQLYARESEKKFQERIERIAKQLPSLFADGTPEYAKLQALRKGKSANIEAQHTAKEVAAQAAGETASAVGHVIQEGLASSGLAPTPERSLGWELLAAIFSAVLQSR